MNQSGETVIDQDHKENAASPFVWSGIGRTLLALFGIVLPFVSFATSYNEGTPSLGTPWQDGQLSTYAYLMTSFPPAGPFYPFLIYSATCLGLLVFNKEKFENYLIVRFGVYSGVVLSIQYHGILYPAQTVLTTVLFAFAAFLGIVLITTCGLLIIFGLQSLVSRFIGLPGHVSFAMLLIIGIAIGFGTSGFQFFAGVLLVGLMLSTTLCIATYSVVAYYLFRRPKEVRFKLIQAFGLFSWLAVYMAAWRQSIQLAIIQYQQLPTEQPGCYVCSAAAKGHDRFVKSSIRFIKGDAVKINDQIRTLKAFEIALRAVAPNIHRFMRATYDAVGPVLANRLTTAWHADFAYATLKPLEWVAGLALHLLGVDSQLIDRFYR